MLRGLGARCRGFEFVGLGRESIFKARFRVLFDGLRIFKIRFGGLALSFRVEQAIVRGGDLIDDAAMGIVESEIRCQEICFGGIDFSAASAAVEDKILDVEHRLEYAFCLAVVELTEEGRRPKGRRDGNRRDGGVQRTACDA